MTLVEFLRARYDEEAARVVEALTVPGLAMDGVTDDGPAIQAALDRPSSARPVAEMEGVKAKFGFLAGLEELGDIRRAPTDPVSSARSSRPLWSPTPITPTSTRIGEAEP